LKFDMLSNRIIGCAIEVHKIWDRDCLNLLMNNALPMIGLILNFNVKHMKNGIKRMVL
jgi:hypothetical protein